MSQRLLVRFCFLCMAIQLASNSAWAFKRESRVTFRGYNGYSAAAGEAHYLEVRYEPKQKDREELVIEIKNVPMAPGTRLVVYVDDKEVGNVVLDNKRAGVLKLTSDSHKHVTVVEPGTMIQVKTVDGRMVMK